MEETMNKREKQKPCPCCGQLVSARTIEMARQQGSPAEDPEQAFRRGYHHGAFIVTEALKDRIDPTLWRKIDAFVGCVGNWRRAWRYLKPSQQRRDHAPEPGLLYETGRPAAVADSPALPSACATSRH
jgi:hypothetical protein